MTAAVSDVFSSMGLGATPAQKKSQLGQDDFLRLMVTQLKNQDPLKPLESTEFLSQLAQFSTVSGVESLNTSFGTLASSLNSNQALQASGLVGNRVLAPGNSAMLGVTGDLEGAVDLPSSASAVAVDIIDASGATVRTINLGPQDLGLVHFNWDGNNAAGQRAAAGKYTLSAHANIAGGTEAVSALGVARVDSVTLNGADGLILNLAGLGPLPFGQVRQILSAST
jgi:flagellar basal-body rod modification protein FlgD